MPAAVGRALSPEEDMATKQTRGEQEGGAGPARRGGPLAGAGRRKSTAKGSPGGSKSGPQSGEASAPRSTPESASAARKKAMARATGGATRPVRARSRREGRE